MPTHSNLSPIPLAPPPAGGRESPGALTELAAIAQFKVWYGIGFFTWLSLLSRYGHRIALSRIPVAVIATFLSLFNSCAGFLSRLIFARRILAVELDPAPIFVIGHWRTGTTYLHELLSCDTRFISPKGYQCGAPRIFFVCETWFRPLLGLFTPSRRPMDNMAFDLERPQEDEYAMLGLVGRSNYRSFIFPSAGPLDSDYLSLRALPEALRTEWLGEWVYFLKSVAARHEGRPRLVLKTPQHTARLAAILKVFPEARFVHLVRNPLTLYSSTVSTWRALCDTQGLESRGKADGWIAESVLATLEAMYACFEEDRPLIAAGRILDVRYETLAADPAGTIAHIYRELGLDGFEAMKPALLERVAEAKTYQTNTHRLTEEQVQAVRARWGDYIRRYGYSDEVDGAVQAAGRSA